MSCACPQAAHSQAAALARRRACASHALPLPFAGEARQRRAGVASAAADDGGGVLAFLKGVQAGLPVIGLVSRLAAPGGGVEAGKLGYQEYTRACFERDTEESRAFGFAVAELSRTRKLVRAAAQAARLREAPVVAAAVSLPAPELAHHVRLLGGGAGRRRGGGGCGASARVIPVAARR